MTDPNEIVARRLLKQAEWCERLGSRLYSSLLRQAAADSRTGGVCWTVLRGHHDDPPDSALALRFLGAVHRLALQGQAPQLAAFYPSLGGDPNGGDADADRGDPRNNDPWPAFLAVVQQHTTALRELVRHPVQTNEVGRCAALLGGFLEVARQTRLPLRLFEAGAAGGLILRWDHYRYQAGDEGWGDVHSPVRIAGAFAGAHPRFDQTVEIVERRGCDAAPIDPCSEEGRLTLQSYVWPDQVDRLRQLSAAIAVARRVPARVDQANAADWIEATLAERSSSNGAATVVYHSITWQYLPPADRDRIAGAMAAAGRAATRERPLAWLRFEPAHDVAEVRLQLWPGGEDRLLARSGFHGKPVEWLGG
ncbi:MAG TPA: DUF2332 domain-containing protein [Candidatus Angelobacter sp.]